MERTMYVNGVQRTEKELVRGAYGRGLDAVVKVAGDIAEAVQSLSWKRMYQVSRDAGILFSDATGISPEGIVEAVQATAYPITVPRSAGWAETVFKLALGATAATAILC